ncbi:LytR/AlgR family response regulator transcription factor [Aquimarina mytili]|uniref:LytTR family transcriptional regulator n=1 Tax=Aquimarina mytili TaxID=874423 RepID=A0A936ZWA0_9FLAO|nr:LytTR family DNA-binding domain-containing protein [Aquimarina mytili]MBL0685462.1 LytTR family transcriptional regulator [Aquimarina mytili]
MVIQLVTSNDERKERKDQLYYSSDFLNKIALPVSDGILFLTTDDIICFEADGMYTKVHSKSKGVILISKPLKHFDSLMKNKPLFFRPHRSFLINLNHIKQFIKKDGAYIIMENELTVSISKEKREKFLELIY